MTEPKPWLTAEWQQRCLDALHDSLNVHADLKREMVEFLLREGFWDATRLSWDAAISRFNDCIRPGDARAHFTNLQLWALVKRFERHAWFHAMAEDLGYEVRRKPTEERRLEALERLAKALEENNKIASTAHADLASLGEALPRRYHHAVRDGVGSFSTDPGDGANSKVLSL